METVASASTICAARSTTRSRCSSPSCLRTTKSATLQPIDEIGALCRERGVLFHTDAAQAAGKLPVDVNRRTSICSRISGHKIYGPKGVGALYVRRRNPQSPLAEQMHGGGHERGMRSGTLNVPGIVGLGTACEIAAAEMAVGSRAPDGAARSPQAKIEAGLERIRVNGSQEHRLPGNLNITFEHVDSEIADDGPEGCRAVERLGLHLGRD